MTLATPDFEDRADRRSGAVHGTACARRASSSPRTSIVDPARAQLTIAARGRASIAHFAALLALASATEAAQAPPPAPHQRFEATNIPYYPGAQSCRPTVGAAQCSVHSTHCLDVMIPANVQPSSPTILYVHEGAWHAGLKDSAELSGFLETLVSLGYRVVSCNYSLSCDDLSTPGVLESPSYPDAILDVRAALGWIRTSGLRPPFSLSECVVVVGGSSGGHLAAMVGALGANTTQFLPQGYPPTTDLSVQLTITFSADFDLHRRGWSTLRCPCSPSSSCPAVTEPHLSSFANDLVDMTQRFIGRRWLDGSYAAVPPPPPGRWDYATLQPGVLTGDPFLNASPTHWLSEQSSPFYMLHSQCDKFFPAAELAWMTEAAERANVSTGFEVTPCGHGLRMLTEQGSALKIDQVIRTWNGYAHCP